MHRPSSPVLSLPSPRRAVGLAALTVALTFSSAFATACSSSSTGADATDAGTSSEGRACKGDGDCAAGYRCVGARTTTDGCTPNRPCRSDECATICLTTPGGIDLETGKPTAECLDRCKAEALCCDGPGSTTTTDGTCRKSSPTPDSDSGVDTAPAPIDWSGTWSATVSYTTSCDVGFGSMKTGKNTHTLTVTIKASGGALEVTPQAPDSGWTPMSGTGDAGGATISGEFPFRDHAGDTVSSKDNSSTLRLTEVDGPKKVRGSFEGKGSSRFGFKCTTSGGVVELTR